MIRINLLPHREAARKRRREVFNLAVGGSVLLGGVLAGVIFLGYGAEISDQQKSNRVLTAEINQLDGQIKEMAGLQAEIAVLKARQQAVEDLQSGRNVAVHLLTELVKQLPEGVFIAKMVQVDQVVTLNGMAQSNERVSELLGNWEHHAAWLGKPELVEIAAAGVVLPTKEPRRVASFVLRLRLLRTSEADKAVAPEHAVADRPGSAQVHAAVIAAATHE